MRELLEWGHLFFVSEVAEHGRGDTPLLLANSVAFELLLALFVGHFCRVIVDNLVKASQDVASGDVLERESSLDEQAALWDFNGLLFPVSGPDGESWIARFAVDCHEADVIVKTSKHCAVLVKLLQVGASGSQQVGATLHLILEGVLFDTHTSGCHLRDCVESLQELVAPRVHLGLPVSETLWHNLREVRLVAFKALTNFPHEAPLGIKHRLKWRHRSVLRCKPKLLALLCVVTSLLNVLRSRTDLVVTLRLDVVDHFASVKELAGALEVTFHEVNVFFIVLHVHSWVANNQNAELVEALCNLLALEFCQLLGGLAVALVALPGKKDIKVDHWHLCELFADNLGAFGRSRQIRLDRDLLIHQNALFHNYLKPVSVRESSRFPSQRLCRAWRLTSFWECFFK